MVAAHLARLRALIKRTFLFHGGLLGLEQGQAVLRFAITTLSLVYIGVIYLQYISPAPVPRALIANFAYLIFAIGYMIVSFRAFQYSPTRCRIANIGDVFMISYLMIALEKHGVPLTVLYLWVTIGNGLRFGVRPMMASAVLSLAGFTTVVINTEIWQQQAVFIYAVFLMMVLLPAYTAVLLEKLHQARIAAETANCTKTTFFARISHDLRSPMNGILTATDILRKSKGLPPEHQELLSLIQDSAEVSLRQIDNVLDFAKLEAGRLTVDAHPFELQPLVAASVRMVANAAQEKKLRLLAAISPKIPNNVIGDAHHLRMVLMNLLTNAIKFTETGYVALKVEPVSETPDAVTLRFSIKDTGIGMGPDALAHIWETFRQEHSQATRRYGGAGLGTTIAKQLVELMGGRISVTSNKGKGSLFWFEVPLARHTATANGCVTPPARVLLLSEDIAWVDTLRAGIAPSGAKIFVVNSAEDVYAAFARAARFGRSWHFVVVDDTLVRRQGGVRCEAVFMDAAQSMRTPMYLLTDVSYSDHELWERGYCAALPGADSLAMISALITAPRMDESSDDNPNIVRVAPWIWAGVGKSIPKILIADDNYSNRKVITLVLESAGYAVDAVSDGESALQRLSTGDYKAVVLDLHMPEMDGMEVVQHYKTMLPGKTRPMVILSSDTTDVSRVELAMAGASAYLTKPVRSDVLVATLERLIGEQDVVPLILNSDSAGSQNNAVSKVLDMEVLADLERVCKDSKELIDVIKAFETEANNLLVRIDKAMNVKGYDTLAELIQAMKGVAANVGAVRMVAVCDRILNLSPLEANAMMVALVRELREVYAISRNTLYEFIGSSQFSRV